MAVLDDIFPHPLSAFRYEEFCSYLDAIPRSAVFSNGQAFPAVLGETRTLGTVISAHLADHPRHAGRVNQLRPDQFPRADAYYAIFLHNIAEHVAAIEHAGKPFAFTLYPGGGFQVDEKASDAKLQRVCGSPNFRHVIATNHFTETYLRDKSVPASKIVFIEGGVVPRAALMEPDSRKHFGIDKDTLDIAFIANRYMPTGEDKGYDLFVAAAEALEQGGLGATYHVIGPWDANVIPLGRLAERFRFHGFLETGGLRQLCQTIDLIISPNRPNRLAPGAFDGFPTGSCVEAGLQQAAIFCTDAFKLNVSYEDGADIVVIEPVLSDILRKLMPVLREPAALAQLGKNARTSLVRVFGLERQLTPRLSLLRGLAYS